MNESIINHLFLPHHLPSSADDDFLIQSDHQNEYKILECMKEFLTARAPMSLPIFRTLTDCIKRWSALQNAQKFSVSTLQTALKRLPAGSFLPLYFHAQNAAILIEIDDKDTNQPIISSWQVLLPSTEITSSLAPHLSCFPVRTYRLNGRSELISQVHCELLMDFTVNTIEYSKSSKASREVNEIREIPESHYVCQWWIQQFKQIKIETESSTSIQFTKKHRDHIRWDNGLLPFRRSGLWMTLKIVFHTILIKRLGQVGTIVYKLLITRFLTHVIHPRKRFLDDKLSTDLLVHCARKLVRRLNKIEGLLSAIDSNDMIEWIQHTKQEIKLKIDEFYPKIDWQANIQRSEEKNNQLIMRNFKGNDPDIYQHLCPELKAHLTNQHASEESHSFSSGNYDDDDDSASVDQVDDIPSMEELTKTLNYTIDVALIRMEIWVESDLEEWINRPSRSLSETNSFEILLHFYEEYQTEALKHYWSKKGSTDPMGYSRFILTSLTMIRCMHEKLCNHSLFERLKHHSIDIPNLMKLFEFLVLSNRKDMIRVHDLYDYFDRFSRKPYPDLLASIDSANAFGVHYAAQSSTMNESIQEIRTQATKDKEKIIKKVNEGKQKYATLMDAAKDCACECVVHASYGQCHYCKIQQEARNIIVKIYECPLPSHQTSALAVIFELQMPMEIRCYRDILWQFINRPNPYPKSERNMHEWLSVPPHKGKLKSFYTGSDNSKVRLVSPVKSMTQSHYSGFSIASASVDDFLYESSLKVTISPNKPAKIEDECRQLTPQLEHSDYKQLQFTLDSTEFVQNQVIAKLCDCPSRLKPSQWIEFGSFRSGHRLQWWNLLTILEMDSLSIGEESVAILIIHSILQYGPVTDNSEMLTSPWCPESHRQILEDHFLDEFIVRLYRHLEDCKLNWQSELVLFVIVMITMRILNICNRTRMDKVAHLVLECRRIGEHWIDLISESIVNISSEAFNEVEKLRLKKLNIGICCLLTFSTDQDRINCLLSSNEHVLSWLKATTTVCNNTTLHKDQSQISTLMSNMMRFSERVSVMVQPILAKFLENTSYQSLNEFVALNWVVIKRNDNINGQWKKRKADIYDGWYDGRYASRSLSIDCIKGTFLVDGMTLGVLPETIIANELFIRVFGHHNFQVQPSESSNTYITKQSYHHNGRVRYEFHFNEPSKLLTINERHIHTNDVFQLIPHACFETKLPHTFVFNHSHWWNEKDQTVEFRPVHFNQAVFLDSKPYVLSLETGYLTTTETNNPQFLINQSSTLFQRLFNTYFIRLDDQPYVYMTGNSTLQAHTNFHIHLSRLGIAFQYNDVSKIITSREYPDMSIEDDQWVGTLTGLKSGLVLSSVFVDDQILEHYPYRKLIVPFGEIHSTESLHGNHQTVSIQRTTLPIGLAHKYFVFTMNDRLQILQPTESPAGWLYLALLHAMTSHPLPDKYTGLTGMERAFQLLTSAGCWSDQPFDPLCLNILGQIAAISPKVNYYPEYLTRMEKIDWNSNGLPYSMQHFGYYLIAQELIHTSEQLSFMYPSSISDDIPEIFESKLYNERLLTKLYWDYRDSYNPLARLHVEMNDDAFYSAAPYQPPLKHCSHATNYPVVRLVDDLYRKGTVNLKDCSEQNWLPLSQWLADENQLRTIWIGLLKASVYAKIDEIERLEKLLDFLYYISNRVQINPFYLQLLQTALHKPGRLLTSVTFPPFLEYSHIEEITVVKERIDLSRSYTVQKRNQIITEVQSCWLSHCNYENRDELVDTVGLIQINQLLTSWENNKILRSFLEVVHNRICSVPIKQFRIKVSSDPQKFTVESMANHYQIKVKCTEVRIDRTLLKRAEQKFHHPYSDHFNKPTILLPTINRQNQFPKQIFSVINDPENALDELDNYFRNQLDKSWQRLSSDEHTCNKNASIKEMVESLHYLRKESSESWNELIPSITESDEQLFEVGLVSRITPTTLLSYFQQNVEKLDLTTDQPTLLGGILVNWTLQQQLERILHCATLEQWEDFEEERSNIPHANWTPSDHVSWLMLQLEMNITIRDIQIKVARHMIQPDMSTNDNAVKNIVMQMNMGEGKTSVILPMLVLSLSSSETSLVRIVVLKSLFPTNYQSLRYKLGGLLNRRVFPFASRRDMNFHHTQIDQIFSRFREALINRDVILTSPEDILSFDLLTIDNCRQNKFETGLSMLTVQRWLKKYTRDILDEADEILDVKYQLIYTVGGQQQVDAGAERWKTIQSILDLVRKHAEDISKHFPEEVCYQASKRKSAFPHFRLQSSRPFLMLSEKIATDWIQNRNYRSADKEIILSFILETKSSVEGLVDKFSHHEIQSFLIVRGLLSAEVLLIALEKRYRVNYGINPNLSFNRLMAVPFRAKDVVADRTEFGHPDLALLLTQLSYYYSGLSAIQISQCLNRLHEKETDPESVYEGWISYDDGDEIPSSIRQWKGINLTNYQEQTCTLFPTLRYNMFVINYFLNHFVFPREAKQFPYKLVASAWDLSTSARSKMITGFSGTNGTQLLLPTHIRQYDLPELQKTDAVVVNNLLQPENERYQSLPIHITSNDILNRITNYTDMINVILDVGALLIDGTNRDIAVTWLHLSDKTKIDYAVYFDSDSIFVCDRQLRHQPFITSPASERLDHCVFYLDEIHTRGTDFKFPNGFRGAVTLGTGLTKDRFVQACMRMRKIGAGHSLTFWSSYEVHQQITVFKEKSSFTISDAKINDPIGLIDILRWVYQNTVHSTWDGLHHWAVQSLSFQRKVDAFQNVQWENHEQVFTGVMMKKLARKCFEPEITALAITYGAPKTLQTIDEIYCAQYQQSPEYLSAEIHNAVIKRLRDYGGKKKRLSNLLNEEHQRELEQEVEEERLLTRPPPVRPCAAILQEEILRLCDTHGTMMDLSQFPSVFHRLPYAFTNTTFDSQCQPNSWQENLWVSNEFQRVISFQREVFNPFLRPPRWIIVYRNQHIIFVSALEANALIGRLNSLQYKQQPTTRSTTTIRSFLPRIKRAQSIFVNTPTLTIPPSVKSLTSVVAFSIPLNWLVQLFIFNGTLYFGSIDEQTSYCKCLGLCPKPRTVSEEKFFEKGWIAVDGFISNPKHRRQLQIYQDRFGSNPLTFVRELIENRINSPAPITSHVGSILLNSYKLI